MPIYLFRCPACDSEHDVFMHSSSYSDEQDCPACGARMVRKFTPQPSHIFHEYYSYGLGQHMERKSDVKDTMRRREQEHFDTYGFPIAIEPKF